MSRNGSTSHAYLLGRWTKIPQLQEYIYIAGAGFNDFPLHSRTATQALGREARLRAEADEVPGIKHCRLDFHPVVKELREATGEHRSPSVHLGGGAPLVHPRWCWVWPLVLSLPWPSAGTAHLNH